MTVMNKNFMERYLEKYGAKKRLRRYFYLMLAVSLVLGLIVQYDLQPSTHFAFEKDIPAFYALFGFLACAIILVGSKLLGNLWLQAEEDYYSKDYADYFVRDEKDEERVDKIMDSIKDSRKEVPE